MGRQNRSMSSLYAMLSLHTIPLWASPCFHTVLGLSELQTALSIPPATLSSLSRRSVHALWPSLSSEKPPDPPTAGTKVPAVLLQEKCPGRGSHLPTPDTPSKTALSKRQLCTAARPQHCPPQKVTEECDRIRRGVERSNQDNQKGAVNAEKYDGCV